MRITVYLMMLVLAWVGSQEARAGDNATSLFEVVKPVIVVLRVDYEGRTAYTTAVVTAAGRMPAQESVTTGEFTEVTTSASAVIRAVTLSFNHEGKKMIGQVVSFDEEHDLATVLFVGLSLPVAGSAAMDVPERMPDQSLSLVSFASVGKFKLVGVLIKESVVGAGIPLERLSVPPHASNSAVFDSDGALAGIVSPTLSVTQGSASMIRFERVVQVRRAHQQLFDALRLTDLAPQVPTQRALLFRQLVAWSKKVEGPSAESLFDALMRIDSGGVGSDEDKRKTAEKFARHMLSGFLQSRS